MIKLTTSQTRRPALMLLALMLLSATMSLAQVSYMENEVAHQISNKAEQGYLGDVNMDADKKEITLSFVTATKAKKIKVEKYVFDYDLNFKTSEKEEYEQAKDVKSKYKWFKFRNEEVEKTIGVTAEPTMMGNLVFKRKEITSFWSWYYGGYRTEVKVTDKLKPRNDEGNKYYYRGHFDNDETGELLALVSPKINGKDFYKMHMEYNVLKVDKDLNIVSKVDIMFENPQYLIWKGVFDNTGDFAAIFAPTAGMGMKNESEKPTEYTYVRINPKGEVVERIPFETKATRWMIGGVYEKDGITTIYGAGFNIGKPKDAYADFKNYAPVYKGFDNMQVVSIKGGKLQYVSAPKLDEIASKTVAPSGQKKAKEYDGGRIRVTGVQTAPNGDVLIMAQMVNYNPVSQLMVYKDFMVFHFAGNGDLKKTYSIDTPAKGGLYNTTDPLSSPATRPSESEIFISEDGKTALWTTALVTKVDKSTVTYYFLNEKTTTWTPREQLLVSTIDLTSANMTEVQTVGDGTKGKKDFFLRKDIRFVPFGDGKRVLVIGEDRLSMGVFSKNDNYIYLGKLSIAMK
ncbi:MAG: hypothetical protein JNK18_15580 [Cyclobacteriaceae bacterium]|nr:hypothetical protein [Cyclobacteriaceae bacterium]